MLNVPCCMCKEIIETHIHEVKGFCLCQDCWDSIKEFIESGGCKVCLDDDIYIRIPPISRRTYKLVPVEDNDEEIQEES